MLVLNTKTMTGVHVFTKSGQALGKVASFDMEASTGRMIALWVKHSGLIQGVLSEDIHVGWDQVLEMTPEKVIVADAYVLAADGAKITGLSSAQG